MSINRMMLLNVLEQSTCCWTLIELCKKVKDRQAFHPAGQVSTQCNQALGDLACPGAVLQIRACARDWRQQL